MGDDPRLLAQVATVLARRGSYLPVIDGPRVHRPDRDAEVIRRSNAIARVRPREILFAALPSATCDLFTDRIPRGRALRIDSVDELEQRHGLPSKRLAWGETNLGLGTLRALRDGRRIVFDDGAACPQEPVASRPGHLVVCETDDEFAQVVAANYAFAIDAGLCLIPAVAEEQAQELLAHVSLIGGGCRM